MLLTKDILKQKDPIWSKLKIRKNIYQVTVDQNKAGTAILISNKKYFKAKKYKGQRLMIILVKGKQ